MYPHVKRIFDIISASIACLVLSAILIPIAIVLLCTGEHYVFYFQNRIGFKNKVFNIFKFATMLKNSPNIGTGEITLRNDPRLLPIGGFLRKTKINELPQLLNVVLGTMSVVGPRPLMQVSFNHYSKNIQDNIYNVRPGITGIGSVIFRDEERLVSEADDAKAMYAKIFPYKGELELWYQKNQSFVTDLKIIFLTAYSIVKSDNNLAATFFKDLPKRNF
jgi:lipopolysaccharide/colanic/teichoic acid biosynthesis glycosyltransferase